MKYRDRRDGSRQKGCGRQKEEEEKMLERAYSCSFTADKTLPL